MRSLSVLSLVVVVALPARGQQDSARRDSARIAVQLSRELAAQMAEKYNEPAALRASGSLEIPERQRLTGDVAVLNGPLTIAGTVTGRVVVINGDVILRPSARIDGDLWVAGGVIDGADRAHIGGLVHHDRHVLHYRQEGDRIIAVREDDVAVEDSWYRRFRRRHEMRDSRILLWAGTYNRVEGLPVVIGPQLQRNTEWGKLKLTALGIVRSADGFEWKADNLGYDVTGEVQLRQGVSAGGKAFDVVDPVEGWQLKDSEVGLASFFLHEDYRDYFERHGGAGYLSLFQGEAARLRVGYGAERWASRASRDPFTLFRNDRNWRVNPEADDGLFHILDATLGVDTRNDADNPWSGWLIIASVEHGSSPETMLARRGQPVQIDPPSIRPAPSSLSYTRGFLDLRRYNRVSPGGQLNMRLVLGGRLGGDPLPLERRFSLGGPGTLPGYDFRRTPSDGGPDVLQCGSRGSEIAGRPALCERMALVQVEYRGDVHLGLHSSGDLDDWHFAFDRPGSWVLFADAGRGWLVGAEAGGITYPSGSLPPLRSFRSDIGAGLDFGVIGFFLAKSISDAKEPANFFVRLRHRF
ncbi:MAG: BamA/TamA family outer membrane protein [Gemmatimonadota bacterium]|nr:BamA/TamA family outer membrane protein [Gemmatimonadota bacterium]